MIYGFAYEGLRDAASGHARAEGAAYVCDDDKYFWVQAESLAAAARKRGHSGPIAGSDQPTIR